MRAPRSIDAAQVLVGLGGMLLFVSLFLDWYQPGMTAWTVFEVLDLVLAVLALMAAWIVVSSLLLESPQRDELLPIVGGVAFVVVVSQLINHPPAAQGASLKLGAWLGLGGAALMAAGAALGLAHVSLTISFTPRERREDDDVRAEPRRRSEPSPSTEAAAIEPEVHDELYPEHEREGPIGADDPALWSRRGPDEDDTLPFDHERGEGS
jgi:hypothetical protein